MTQGTIPVDDDRRRVIGSRPAGRDCGNAAWTGQHISSRRGLAALLQHLHRFAPGPLPTADAPGRAGLELVLTRMAPRARRPSW
jgi:hypothetical protein